MENISGLHNGHRSRMMQKVFASPNSLSDHELLEALLYFSIPRKDTNLLAHQLIRAFGSIEGVFGASKKELETINGVGVKTAELIMLAGNIYKRLLFKVKPQKEVDWSSFDKSKGWLIDFYKNVYEEQFLIVLLSNKHKEILKMCFEDKNKFSVTADIPEIANAFALHKPKYAIIAHNHPSGELEPSGTDDYTTMKINMLCAMYNVTLADHVIVAGGKAYSYRFSGKLEILKQRSNVDDMLKEIAVNNGAQK